MLLRSPVLSASGDGLLRFTVIFSSPSTAEQYVKHVRFAHGFAGHNLSGFDTRVDCALKGVGKAQPLVKKQAPAVSWEHPRELMGCAFADIRPRGRISYKLASCFLMRVKNELLSLTWNSLEQGGQDSSTIRRRESLCGPAGRNHSLELGR